MNTATVVLYGALYCAWYPMTVTAVVMVLGMCWHGSMVLVHGMWHGVLAGMVPGMC